MSPAAAASSDALRLLCVGSTVVDVSIQGLQRFPVPDVEFTQISDVTHEQPARLLLGGTAANTAMVYAGLTGGCHLGGVIGADPFGDFLAAGLAAHGVNVLGERAGSTATHTIALGVDGRRQAYWYPGPPLDPAPLLAAWPPGHVYLSGINLCFRRPLTAGACAFGRAARTVGAKAVLDIGQGGPGALDFDEITAIATEMDLLIGSRAEFAAALGCELSRKDATGCGSGLQARWWSSRARAAACWIRVRARRCGTCRALRWTPSTPSAPAMPLPAAC